MWSCTEVDGGRDCGKNKVGENVLTQHLRPTKRLATSLSTNSKASAIIGRGREFPRRLLDSQSTAPTSSFLRYQRRLICRSCLRLRKPDRICESHVRNHEFQAFSRRWRAPLAPLGVANISNAGGEHATTLITARDGAQKAPSL